MRPLRTAVCFACLAYVATPAQGIIVDMAITVDNAYAFGYGDVNGVSSPLDWYGGVNNVTACQIFCASGPEYYYGIDSGTYDYAYIAAWADDATAQGVLAGFSFLSSTVSSVGAWEVFATGDLTTSASAGAFDRLVVNSQVALANTTTGAAGGSIGWVGPSGGGTGTVGSLAIDTGTQYVSGVADPSDSATAMSTIFDPTDDWMWYDNGLTSNPFDYTSAGDGGWLIFRAGVVPEPATGSFLGLGLLGLLPRLRRRRLFI